MWRDECPLHRRDQGEIARAMNALEQAIVSKIRRDGAMPFASFMEMALYHRGLGYYAAPHRTIGGKGDFYTSPHLHPVFGAVLAKVLMEMWQAMGHPPVFHLVEMGAGAGHLGRDILDYLHHDGHREAEKRGLLASLSFCIVEPYGHFREKQQENLGSFADRIQWVESPKALPSDLAGCVFSNELLDAFPVHLVVMGDVLQEIYVDFDGARFTEEKKTVSSGELTDYVDEFELRLHRGYRTEINLRMRGWLSEISRKLSHGFLLTIDYGYSTQEYYNEQRTSGTLLCYHQHQLNENPYAHIGEQDITAHVNFSALKKWGEELGLQSLGYAPQGAFLTAAGMDEAITELYADAPDYLSEILKIKGLILPQGMGESHNVMIQYKGEGFPQLRGFTLRNRLASL